MSSIYFTLIRRIHGQFGERGVVNGPLKNGKSRQIVPKSRNLTQPTNGSRGLRFCVCRSHICFPINSLHFFVSGSEFKMSVSASRRVSDLPITTPRAVNLWLADKQRILILTCNRNSVLSVICQMLLYLLVTHYVWKLYLVCLFSKIWVDKFYKCTDKLGVCIVLS